MFHLFLSHSDPAEGPFLEPARRYHACAELQIKSKTYIVVTGGSTHDDYLKDTKILDKSDLDTGFFEGEDLPVHLQNHRMISAPDKKSVYVLGGIDKTNAEGAEESSKIYQFTCGDDIGSCQWKESGVTLKYARDRMSVMAVPDSFVEEACQP